MTIKEVYETYRQYDEILSDRELLCHDINGHILFDLWQAVKEASE